ncbi:MAG: UDP-N-acetylmuramoyl-L-alanyl-D-glutamate--2,6-diaminopimelate ligase [Planctomycetota bacterium]|nr:MAG: UDP-N-acetylmuramoyl-L-alanyl-D-glutamate--2,6-diaminopimelate ligase [Planctomycetota bacterium]
MRLSALAEGLQRTFATSPWPWRLHGMADPDLARACFDSREVQPGDLFCALPGGQQDGLSFWPQARQSGAVALFRAAPGPAPQPTAPEIQPPAGVPVAQAAGWLAACLAGFPADQLFTAAVTGTNGKTTVVHLLQQALQAASIPTARIGTLGFAFGGREVASLTTSPAADRLHAWLRSALDQGARAAVLEASSHGLVQHRLAGLRLDVAAWTNLSHDHLDYHGDMERYAAAKARLIHGLSADAVAWLPAAVEPVLQQVQGALCQKATWTLVEWEDPAPAADLIGRFQACREGFQLKLEGAWGGAQLQSPLVGRHNAENLVVAFALARSAGLDPEQAASALAQAQGAPGRLEVVAPESPWHLFVDYAHTPEALARVLSALADHFPGRRLGVVFGAGGDRDPSKRESMGRLAAEASDWCLVTSDNPRGENPESIAQAVAAGVAASGRPVEVEVDRRRAIRTAVARLRPGEVLLVAGKGHEPYQEIDGVRHPFDDRLELQEAARCSA